jgi:membrane protein
VPASGWRQILVRAWKEQNEDNISLVAGAVAYFTFLAIFPALIAAISIWGLVTRDPETAVEQAESFTGQLPEEASSIVDDQLRSVAGNADGALTLGVVFSILLALWAAASGTGALIKALNIAYDEEDGRGFVRGRALALALTVGGIFFGLIAIGLVAVLPAVLTVVDVGFGTEVLIQIGRWVLLTVVIMVALAVLYRVAPDRNDPRIKWVSPGALLATVLWLLASVGFSLYVSNFGSYGETYGSVAGAAVLLLWLYLTAFIVLLGAEVNAEAERQTHQDTTVGPPRPIGERDAYAADTKPTPEREADDERSSTGS